MIVRVEVGPEHLKKKCRSGQAVCTTEGYVVVDYLDPIDLALIDAGFDTPMIMYPHENRPDGKLIPTFIILHADDCSSLPRIDISNNKKLIDYVEKCLAGKWSKGFWFEVDVPDWYVERMKDNRDSR